VYLQGCGHSVCLRCARAMLAPEDLSVACPLDKIKTQFNLSSSGDVIMPLNRPVMAIYEAVDVHLRYCEVCERRLVAMVCAYDMLRLCEVCAKRHKATRHLRSHLVYCAASQSLCPEHHRRTLWMCFTEGRLLCCECGDFGELHRLCQVVSLAKARTKLLGMLRRAERKAEGLIDLAKGLAELSELPLSLQRQSLELRSLRHSLARGPSTWVSTFRHCLEVSRCQQALARSMQVQARSRTV
jgi:hypothetical protein